MRTLQPLIDTMLETTSTLPALFVGALRVLQLHGNPGGHDRGEQPFGASRFDLVLVCGSMAVYVVQQLLQLHLEQQ
jgi:hypothetical protein